MAFIPTTDSERRIMLDTIGVKSTDELFADIPEVIRFPRLKLPKPLSEMELVEQMRRISRENITAGDYVSFMGAGVYNHFIPPAVKTIVSRSEFYTSYTPYQPELSQGTLQTIFEYQSMICELYGMDVANASHYDGATSLAESVLMACHSLKWKRGKVLLADGLNPEYVSTIKTYLMPSELEIVLLPIERIEETVDEDTVCAVVQNPDFFGTIHHLESLIRAVHAKGCVAIVSSDPISLGILKSPGELGADIACGEGQPLGLPPGFGGPYLGIMACREKYLRRMPGRIVGKTLDVKGNVGYVLTLAAREQHIRREKATSNICTNEALCALASTVYLALMGRRGLQRVAEICYRRANYAAEMLSQLDGFKVVSKKPFFREFVLSCPIEPEEINRRLLERKMVGGVPIGKYFPEKADCMIICTTEMTNKDHIDALVEALRDITS